MWGLECAWKCTVVLLLHICLCTISTCHNQTGIVNVSKSYALIFGLAGCHSFSDIMNDSTTTILRLWSRARRQEAQQRLQQYFNKESYTRTLVRYIILLHFGQNDSNALPRRHKCWIGQITGDDHVNSQNHFSETWFSMIRSSVTVNQVFKSLVVRGTSL